MDIHNVQINGNDKDAVKKRFNLSKKFIENARYLTPKRKFFLRIKKITPIKIALQY